MRKADQLARDRATAEMDGTIMNEMIYAFEQRHGLGEQGDKPPPSSAKLRDNKEDQRRQGYLDAELAGEKYRDCREKYRDCRDCREKYREPHPLSYLLKIPRITYRRERSEAAAMVEHLLREGGGELARQQSAARPAQAPLNDPGHWDFFLSHGQAAAGDAVKTLCLLLKERGKTVW